MKSFVYPVLLCTCLGLISCEETPKQEQPVTVELGQNAPDFEFADLASDKREKLSDFKGKVVVAEFWWSKCSLCNDKMDHLQTFITDHPEWKDEVVYLAVSIDPTLGAAKRHIAAVEADENRSWSQTTIGWHDSKGGQSPTYLAYAAKIGVPASYVIDRNGKVAAIDGPTSPKELDLDKAVREALHP